MSQKHSQSTLSLAAAMMYMDSSMKRYEAAVMSGNGVDAESYRQEVHDHLDAVLDCKADVITGITSGKTGAKHDKPGT